MILIADSGATKTSWRIINSENRISQAQTKGFNPFHHKPEVLEQEIREVLKPQMPEGSVAQVFYYGAGCSGTDICDKVKAVITSIFTEANIEVNNDMLGAARALCGHEQGIACILGTGANSCFYNGTSIETKEPSLGYILGDEGSGAYLGKQLLSAYIRKELPDVIMERLNTRFELSRESILTQVYQGEAPARFMSSFSKFIFQNINNPELYRLVYDAFELFFRKNVMKYDNYKSVPAHFTGSVAFYYGNILRQVAADLEINVRNILEDPIAGLTLYHQNINADKNL